MLQSESQTVLEYQFSVRVVLKKFLKYTQQQDLI